MHRYFGYDGDSIRLVLLGDESTGKTCLVSALVSESFPTEGVCSVMPAIVVPQNLTPEKIPLSIVDTCNDSYAKELDDCNGVIIVCSASDPSSVERVSSFWLDKIRSVSKDISIVIAINQIDQVHPDIDLQVVEDEFKKDLNVEYVVQCSAKELVNVPDVFYFAQKAVLYPSAPLLDIDRKLLSQKCVKCLCRIFVLCDKNRDGNLNDVELNMYQKYVFDEPLSTTAICSLKDMLQMKDSKNIVDNGISFEGFVQLHYLSLEKNRGRMLWDILTAFGYGPKLEIRLDYFPTPPKRAVDQAFELTEYGYGFLTSYYQNYDHNDSGIDIDELSLCFEMCTSPLLVRRFTRGFEDGLVRLYQGKIRLYSWLSMWTIFVHLDTKVAVKLLVSMACPIDEIFSLMIHLTARKGNASSHSKRAQYSFHFLVFGCERSGKTVFCSDLVPSARRSNPNGNIKTFCNSLDLDDENKNIVGNDQVYILVSEVPDIPEMQEKAAKDILPKCDLVILMYNPEDEPSLTLLENMLANLLPETHPLIVFSYQASSRLESTGLSSAHNKLTNSSDRLGQLLESYHLHSILLSRKFSTRDSFRSMYENTIKFTIPVYYSGLLSAALHPSKYLPSKPSTRRRRNYLKILLGSSLAVVGVGLALFTYKNNSDSIKKWYHETNIMNYFRLDKFFIFENQTISKS